MFRERWLFSLLAGETILDEHDSCSHWQGHVKPMLKARLFNKFTGQVFLLASNTSLKDCEVESVENVYDSLKIQTMEQCCEDMLYKWKTITLELIQSVQFPQWNVCSSSVWYCLASFESVDRSSMMFHDILNVQNNFFLVEVLRMSPSFQSTTLRIWGPLQSLYEFLFDGSGKKQMKSSISLKSRNG